MPVDMVLLTSSSSEQQEGLPPVPIVDLKPIDENKLASSFFAGSLATSSFVFNAVDGPRRWAKETGFLWGFLVIGGVVVAILLVLDMYRMLCNYLDALTATESKQATMAMRRRRAVLMMLLTPMIWVIANFWLLPVVFSVLPQNPLHEMLEKFKPYGYSALWAAGVVASVGMAQFAIYLRVQRGKIRLEEA